MGDKSQLERVMDLEGAIRGLYARLDEQRERVDRLVGSVIMVAKKKPGPRRGDWRDPMKPGRKPGKIRKRKVKVDKGEGAGVSG